MIRVRPQPDLEVMANKLRDLFHNANDEVFQDGMSSHFSIKLREIVFEYGIGAIDQIREMTHSEETPNRGYGRNVKTDWLSKRHENSQCPTLFTGACTRITRFTHT